MGYISNSTGILRMHSKFNPVFYRLMKQGYTYQVTHQQDEKCLSFVERDNRKINAGKFFEDDQKVQ